MKKVLVLFGKSDWDKAKPFSNKDYQYSYEFFYSLCRESDIEVYRASYEWYDYEKHIFKHAWVYEGAGGQWKRADNIIPDLIYDKTKGRLETYYKKELISKRYPFINDLRFTQMIDDKFLTSLLFQKWSKKNFIVRDRRELLKNIKSITTDKVVLKPISESGGKGIQIFDKEAVSEISFDGEFIIQDFIDSSGGVPGIPSETHDFRIVLVNDSIIYCYIRKPKSGSFLANLAQGGRLAIVPIADLPTSVEPIIEYARSIFSAFDPKIYTIDLMFDPKGTPWVVELNSMPGLYFTPEEKPSMETMYAKLLDVFKEKLKERNT